MLGFKLLALRALAAAADTGASSSDPCYADGSNTFTVSLDEAGSWKFLECGDTAMPVLALEKGVTYTFEQRDASVPARKLQPGRGARAVRRVAATAIGRKRRSNWNYPLAFGTDPSQGDDALPTYYASRVQVDKDAYEDAFVVAQADWLDASGQDQDESEDTSEPDESEDSEEDTAEDEDEGEGGDEEEDSGEGGDESEDTSEPDESEDTSEPDESEDSEEDTAEDEEEDSGEGGDEEEDSGEGGDEEEDAGEGGDESEDTSEPDESEDTSEPDESEDSEEDTAQDEGEGEGGDEEEDAGEEEADEEEDAGEGGDEDADADEDRRLQAAVGYSVTLTVNDEGDDGDLFYLSNAHDYMAGRIKVYENGAPVHTLDTPAIPTEPNVAPSMAPASSPTRMPTPPPPTPKPTPPPSPSPGNPTASPAPAPTAAPIAAPTMAPVAAPTPLPSVAAADTIAAASSSGSGGSGTMTSTAKSNIVATVCVVAAVLIGGAFVAWRRSAQAAAKDPAPALAVQLDAVETDDKV